MLSLPALFPFILNVGERMSAEKERRKKSLLKTEEPRRRKCLPMQLFRLVHHIKSCYLNKNSFAAMFVGALHLKRLHSDAQKLFKTRQVLHCERWNVFLTSEEIFNIDVEGQQKAQAVSLRLVAVQ